MQQMNGVAEAGVSAPASVATAANAQSNGSYNQHSNEVTRFLPVMEITQAVARRDAIVQAMQNLMREGVDYGKVGSDRPTLLQPGADKLCNLFGLVVQYEIITRIEDWSGAEHNGEPFFYYVIVGKAYRGEFLIGEGIGSCNSWEAKYRWRKAERTCPKCGQENIRKSRESGWYCWKKTGGCGAVFSDGDQAIEGQQVGRKPNPDIFDCVNTVQKMAFKRCKVSTTINATSAAEFFTQDIEDLELPDVRDLQRDASKIDTGGNPVGTQAAADFVAQQKLEQLRKGAGQDGAMKHWATRGEMKRVFGEMREKVGERVYLTILQRYGVRDAVEFRNPDQAVECYRLLSEISLQEVA